MHDWFETIALAIIQGVTEFLPISSDGHLSLFQNVWPMIRGQSSGETGGVGAEALFFDVMLHVGTAAAIAWTYRDTITLGARGLLGDTTVPSEFQRPALLRLASLVFVALLPLVPVALFFKSAIEETFQSLTAIGVGFLITAAVLVWTIRARGGEKTAQTMTWVDALLIGLAQAFAPLPGVSRSGLTIAAALGRGLSKTWAVGFSLLLAVPTILGAAAFELRKSGAAGLSGSGLSHVLVGMVLAGLVGYLAIGWLVRIVRGDRLWYFSVYLVTLAAIILTCVALGAKSAKALG